MIKDAASEQTNITGPATSSGLPQRASAVLPSSCADLAGSSWSACVSGVAIQPGAMAFTRMPSLAHASAKRSGELRDTPFTGAVGRDSGAAEEGQHGRDVDDCTSRL